MQLSERTLEGGRLEIKIDGELDLAVAPELRAALEQASDVDQVVISMENCDFIDSTGISVIVHDYVKRLEDGKRVAVAGCSHQVERILSVTGLLDNGLVFATVEDAFAAWEPC